MNTEIGYFHQDYLETVARLEALMADARNRGNKIVDSAEIIRSCERDIERLEGAEILQQTSPTGAINGTNESSQKKQTASLLETLKNQPGPISDLYAENDSNKAALEAYKRVHAADLDDITVCKLRLEHINAVLRALAV